MNPNNELLQAAKAVVEHDAFKSDACCQHAASLLRTAIASAEASASQPAPDEQREKAIEEWGHRMHDAMLDLDHAWDLQDSISLKPFGEHAKHAAVRKCITEAVAMMRRAAAAPTVPSEAEIEAFIEACARIDWGQHLLNGGGCFHVEDGRLCGRAIAWPGHQIGSGQHLFVPLYVAVTRILRGGAS